MAGADAMNVIPVIHARAGARPRRLRDVAAAGRIQRRRVARPRRHPGQPGLRVSAAVLSAEDSRQHARRRPRQDADAAGLGRGPERDTAPLWLLRTGNRPGLLLAARSRVVDAHAARRRRQREHRRHFDRLGFQNPIPAGTTHAGILFTNPERGTKLLNVDLLGQKTLVPFSLFLHGAADDAASGATVAQDQQHVPASQVVDYSDLAELRAALERLPCCAQGPRDSAGRSAERRIRGRARGHRSGDGAPQLSPRYARGRHGASMSSAAARTSCCASRRRRELGSWMRVWRTPLSFDGRPVYLAQAGRPVGGRFAPRDAGFRTA